MWVNSKTAAAVFGVTERAIQKAVATALCYGKKFCSIKSNLLNFTYFNGIGRGGKVLQIWIDDEIIANFEKQNGVRVTNKGIIQGLGGSQSVGGAIGVNGASKSVANVGGNSECGFFANAQNDIKNAQNDIKNAQNDIKNTQNDIKNAQNDSGYEVGGNSLDCREVACATSRNDKVAHESSMQSVGGASKGVAHAKREADLLRGEAKQSKVSVAEFIEYINASKIYPINLTKNKLYAWIRAYNEKDENGEIMGLDGLVDNRGNERVCVISKDKSVEKITQMQIRAQRGRVNYLGIYRAVNLQICKEKGVDISEFFGKKVEFVSYAGVKSYTDKFLKANPFIKTLILGGEDKAISKFLPALGRSDYAVTSINQVVEIDASPLDVITNLSDMVESLYGAVSAVVESKEKFAELLSLWQKRYTLVQLIDTYSGVCSFHISESENKTAIARAVAKYIKRYGKPQIIKGDNGKAFKSKANMAFLEAIGVKYQAVRAYSGWMKPFVERNFGTLQTMLSEHLRGYIGHNINERQNIEFFYSKEERRLKKGQKSNLKALMNLAELQNLVDEFSEKCLNNRYLDRLGGSPREIYNAKSYEAVGVDEFKLSLYMSEPLNRKVLKKGVMVEGIYFYNAKIFEYVGKSVIVRANLNNNKEYFAFDENEKFLGVLAPLDNENGVSVEVAKASQSAFKKALKGVKNDIENDRKESEEIYARAIINAKSQRANEPLKIAAGEEFARAELDRNERKSGEAPSGYDFSLKTQKNSEIKGYAEFSDELWDK